MKRRQAVFFNCFRFWPTIQTKENVMRAERLKEIVRALMSSRFYFDLDVRERYCLVLHVLNIMDARTR